MSDWWRFDTDKGWRGQSSTVGTVLLAAVALVLVAAIGLFAFSDFGGSADSDELLLTDLGSELTASNVTVRHEGGDTLNPEEVTIIIKGAGETTRIPLARFRGSGEEFTAGDFAEDTETNPTEYFIGDFRLIAVHDPSNTLLHESEHSISFADQGVTLSVESKGGDLTTGTAEVWGKPASDVTLANPDEVKWDFRVSTKFTGGDQKVITDNIGDAYTLSVPSQGFDGRSVSDGNNLGVLEAARVSGDTTVTVKAEYVGENAPAGTPSNRKTSTIDVTVADPSETFDISGSIAKTTSNGQIDADYTVTNAGNLTIEQDISYTAIAYDASGNKIEEKTGTSITGVSSGDLTASLSPGSSTGGTVNYEPPQNTEEVELRITPQIGNGLDTNETFDPATFQIENPAWSIKQSTVELTSDYEVRNTGSFSGTTDVRFNATAYDSNGNPIDAAGYSGVTYTDSYTGVQVDSGETLTTGNSQIDRFVVPLPPGADSVRANISTLNDTETKTLDTTPAEFTVTDVSITGISSPSNEVTVSYDIENQGGLADTQDIALKAFDDTGSGFGTADSTTTDSGVSLAPSGTHSNTVTFHTVDPTATAVKIEVVPSGAPALGSAGQDTTSIASPNQVVTLDSLSFGHNASNDIDEIVVGFTVENTGDLTYNSPQPVDITFNNGGSVTKTVQAKVQAGNSKSFTVRSGSLRDAFSSPAGTYTVSGQGDGSGDTKTLQTDPAIAQITTGQNFDPTAQELSVDYSVINTGDLTDDITVELYTLNSPGGSRLDSAPLDQSSATELTSGSSTTGTLTHSVRGKDIISSKVHFEAFADPSEPGSNSDSATGSISGLSPPNFAITSFSASPDFGNSKLNVNYVVENTGGLTATRDISLGVSVGGSQVFSDTKSGTQLQPGQIASESYTPTVADPGTQSQVTVTLDTQDNTDSRTFSVQPATFDVSGVSATYDAASETATVEYSVTNTGDFTDTQTITATALTDGTTAENTGVTLGPGETTGTRTLTVDVNSAGSQTIQVNTSDTSGSDTIDPAAAKFAISITSASVSNGQVTANYEVTNTGEFSDTQDLTLSVDGTDQGSNTVSLAPGDSPKTGSLTSNALSPPSDGQLTVEVVGSGNSNDASTTLSVNPANFEITSFSASFDQANSEIDISHTVTNKNADFPDTQDIVTTVNGQSVTGSPDKNVQLNSGETRDNSLTYDVSSGGTYTVKVSTDDDSRSTDVAVAGTNFDVKNVAATYDQSAETATVTFEVNNTGDLGATQTVEATSDEASNTSSTSLNLGPNGEQTGLSLVVDIQEGGSQTITVSSDDDSGSDSINPAVALFDISITSASLSGGQVTANYEVTNTGDVTDTQDITLNVDGTQEASNTGVSVGPGQTNSGSLTTGTLSSPGDGTFDVVVAGSGNSNDASTTLSANPANFEITSFSASFDQANSEIDISHTVTNTGDFPDTQDIVTTVNGNSFAGTPDSDVQLSSGETRDNTLTYGVSSGGTYTVEVTTADDSRSTDVTVAAPNFDVSNVAATYDQSAETATVTFDVTNTGQLSDSQTISATSSKASNTSSTTVNLGPGGSQTGLSLVVDIQAGGSQTITVSSADDSGSDSISPAVALFDISITSASLSGGQITANYEVTNTGDVTDTQDITLSVDGTQEASNTGVSVGPGQTTSGSLTSSSLSSPADNQFDVVVAGSGNSNDASTTLSANPANFEITSFSASFDAANSEIDISHTVTNTGDFPDTQDIVTTVNGNSFAGTPDSDVQLSPSETRDNSLTYDISSGGTYTVEVSTDDDSRQKSVTVAAPNFEVKNVAATYDQSAETATVTFDVANTGQLADTQDITATSSKASNTSTQSVSIGPGGSKTGLSLTVDIQEGGSQTITVSSDDDSGSDDISPAVALFDITLSSASLSGGEVTANYEVTNTGDVTDTQDITLSVDGTQEASNTGVSVGPGQTTSGSLTSSSLSSPADNQFDVVVAGSGNSNDASTTLSAKAALFDISITSASISKGEVTANYEVTNTGDFPATQDITLSVDGSQEASNTGLTLGGGESKTGLSLTTGTLSPPGDGTFDVVVAGSGNSNDASTTLSANPANFEITSFSASFDQANSEIEISHTVTNKNADFPDTQDIVTTVNGNSFAGTPDSDVQLNPGETRDNTLTYDISSGGTYTVEVSTDDDSRQKSVTVAAPTFDVSNVAATYDQSAETATVTFDVANTGQLAGTQTLDATSSKASNTSTQGVSIGPGGSKTGLSLTVDIQEGGSQTITVSSDDDSGSDDISPAVALFDITLSSASLSGGQITANYEVTNTGDVTDTQDITLNVDGTQEASNTGVSVGPGQTNSGSLTTGTLSSPGDNQFDVTVAGSGNSNDASTTLSAKAALFDITLSSASLSGGKVTANYEVTNTGDFPDTQDITLSVDGSQEASNTGLQLSSGESKTGLSLTTGTLSSPADNQFDVVVAGSGNSNDASTTLSAKAAKFEITSFSASFDQANSEIDISHTVTNTGDFPDTQDIVTTVNGNSFAGTPDSDVQLNPGETRDNSLTYDISSGGTYTVEVSTDDDSRQKSVTVAGATFDVSNVAATYDQSTETATVTFDVANTGQLADTQDITATSSKASNTPTQGVSIGPGGSKTGLSLTVDIQEGGSQTITVSSDDDSGSDSINPAVALFDISITSASLSNSKVTANYEVTNTGDVTDTQDITLSVDGSQEASTTGVSVGPGQTNSGSLTSSSLSSPADNQFDVVVAGSGNSNDASTTLSAKAAKFEITSFSASFDQANSEIEISHTVTNTGDFPDTQDIVTTVNGNSFAGTPDSDVQLNPGETRDNSLTYDVSSGGTYTVEVSTDDDSRSTDVTVAGTNFDVKTVAATYDQSTETATVTFDVNNTGDLGDTQTISATSSEASNTSSTSLNLGPNGKQTGLSLVVDVQEGGSQTITVSSADDTGSDTISPAVALFDISITSASLSGGQITANYDVTNTGDVTDTQDITLSVDGTTEASNTGVSLGPGQTTSGTLTSSSLSSPADNQFDVVVAGSGNSNDASTTVSAKAALFDITLTGASISNGKVTANYEVTNTGDFPDTQDITLSVDGTTEASNTGVQLNSGESKTGLSLTSSQLSPPGDGSFSVVVAGSGNSDDASTTLSVNPANFEITSFSASFDAANSEIDISHTVTNKNADFPDTQDIVTTVNGNSFAGTPDNDVQLLPGGTRDNSLTYDVSSGGTYTVEVSTDDDSRSTDVAVAGTNFDVKNVAATYDQSTETATVTFDVNNTGDLGDTQTISATSSKASNTSSTSLNLGPNAEQTELSLVVDVQEGGSQTITVSSADDSGSDSISPAAALFDISITSASLSNSKVTANYEVTNTGEVTDTQDITLSVDGSQEASNTGVSLGPGQTTSGTLTSSSLSSPGDNQFDVVVAGSGNSNDASKALSAKAALFDITLNSASISNGEVTANYEVTNTGDFPATQDITLSVDGSQEASNTGVQLSSGESKTGLSLTTGTLSPPGDGTFDVVVAGSGNSNDASTTLSVNPANFEITSFSASFDAANSEIDISHTVTNKNADFPDTQDIVTTVNGNSFSGTPDSDVQLNPGEKRDNTLSYDISSGGTYTVEVSTDDDSRSTDVAVAGTNFDVKNVAATYDQSTETATVTFDVNNTGDLGDTQTISATSSKASNTSSTSLNLGPNGEQTGLSLVVDIKAGGSQTITVSSDDDSGSDDISPAVALFDIKLNSASLSGGEVTANYEVTNTGDVTDTQDITLSVDGSQEASNTGVSLGPGQTTSGTLTSSSLSSPADNQFDVVVAGSGNSNDASTALSAKAALFDITLNSASISNGEVTANYEVTNTGDFPATQDITLSVDGSQEASNTGVQLSSGESKTGLSLTTGTLSPPGDGTFDVVVAGSGNSNDASTTLSVNPANFEITSFSASFDAANSEIDISHTVTNKNADFPDTQDIVTTVNGNSFAGTPDSDVQLNSGETRDNSLTYDISSGGTYTVEVSTDDDSRSTDVAVAGTNFDVKNVAATYDQSTETATVTFDVNNTGDLGATQTVEATSDEASNTSSTSLNLGPNGEQTGLSLVVDIKAGGSQTITVSSADDSGSAGISPVAAKFDITLNSASLSGGEVTANYEVTNTGDVTDTQDITLKVDGSDEGSNSHSLGPGTTESGSLDSSPKSPGTYTVEVVGSGTSNDDSTTVTVDGPKFDISINSASISNGKVTANYDVSNTGDLDDTQDIFLKIDGSTEQTNSNLQISGGQSKTGLSLTTGTLSPPGDGQFTVELVGSGNSNDDSTTLSVSSPSFNIVSFSASFDQQNSEIDISHRVRNQNSDFPDTQDIVTTVNGNSFPGTPDSDVQLDPGEKRDNTLSYDISSGGTYTVKVSTDDDSRQTDVNVDPVSLSFTSTSYSYDTNGKGGELEAPGDTLTVDYTIKNSGDFSASPTVDFKLDGTQQRSNNENLGPNGDTSSGSFTFDPTRSDAQTYGSSVTAKIETSGASDSKNIDIYAEPELSSLSTSRSKYVWKCGGSFTIQIGFFCGPGSWEHQFKAGFDYSISDPGNDLGSFSVDVVNTDRSADGLSGEWPTLDESSTSENGNLTVQHTESGYCPSPRPRCVSELSDNPAKFDIDFTVTDDFGDTTDDASDEDFSVINGEEAGLVGAELDMSSIELKDIAGTFADSDGNLNVDAKLKWSADVSNNADKLLIVPTEPDSGFGDNRGPKYKEIVYDPSKKSDLENGDIEINFETDDGATDATLNFKFLDENGSVLTTLKESTGESNKKIEWGGSTQFDAGDIDISNVEYSSGGRPGFDASCPEVDKDDSGFFGSDREQCISNLEVNLDVDWDQSIEPETDVDKVKFIPYDTRGGENFLVDNTDSQGEFTGSLNNIHTDTSNSKYNFLRFEIHHCQFGRQGISTDNVNVKLKYLDSNGNPIPITTGDKSSTTSYKLGNPPGNFGTFGGFLSEKGDDDNPDKNNNNNIDCSNEPGNKPN